MPYILLNVTFLLNVAFLSTPYHDSCALFAESEAASVFQAFGIMAEASPSSSIADNESLSESEEEYSTDEDGW